MTRLRYRIEAVVRRGDQDAYGYVVHDAVKPGKAQRLVDTEAIALARRERIEGDPITFDWGEDSSEDVAPASFATGITTVVVSATPVARAECTHGVQRGDGPAHEDHVSRCPVVS